MKKRITIKEIKNTNKKVYSMGYDYSKNIFKFKSPYAYTSGVYGWNCDVYSIGNCAITIGYRPFGTKIPKEIVKKYDDLAHDMLCSKNFDRETFNALYDSFIDEVAKI